MSLCDLPAHEIVESVKNREISAQEVLDATFARMSEVDGQPGSLDSHPMPEDDQKIHAFILKATDRAMEQAEKVDAQLANGKDPGPLAGVPFSVKDIFCVRGTTSTAGSRILANFTAPYTATPVERMEAAGAVMLGKVNLDEFTYGSSNESSAFQPTPRNPWNPGMVPGGSSGASAAAVAAGEGALSLGTDTAGSIRQPAAFCGVVGVKPTYGRVSRYGLIAFGSSLDCPGPLGRNIKDVALMMEIIAGADPRDGTAAHLLVPKYSSMLLEDVRGMRVGLSPDYFKIVYPDPKTGEFHQEPISSEIESAVLETAETLTKLGVEIIENVSMPHTVYGIPAYFVISRVEAASNLHRYDGVKYGYRTSEPVDDLDQLYRKSRAQGFGLQPKLRILMGMYVSAAQYSEQYYRRALQVRTLIRSDFEAAFDPSGSYRLDALLTPTTPTTAFPIGAVYGDSVLMQYADQLTVPANHAGVPGLSLPAGLDKDGNPIGVQLIGPDFSEGRLFQLGYAIEQATIDAAWRRKKPVVLQKD